MTQHITSVKAYVLVFASLLALTIATTEIAEIDLGPFNVIVAITIAVVKASLVVLFFMHMIHTNHRTKIAAGAGLLWLAFLISLTLSDVLSRGWLPLPQGL